MAKHGLRRLLRRFKNDINGNFGIMAAITVLGLMSAVGLSLDGQRIYTHTAKAQSVADAAGLAAAIHASSNGGEIPTEGATGIFIEGQTYSASELGFELSSDEDITFTVQYDPIGKEVTVTTVGTIAPIMLQLIGRNEITTTNSSNVKFEEPDALKPASILFVLDESGSMWFDDLPVSLTGRRPENATRRIEALRANMNLLNGRLRALGADEQNTPDEQFLRTGVVTYNAGPVNEFDRFGRLVNNNEQGPAGPLKLIIPMDWKSVPESAVNDDLNPFGGTNSGPALQRAKVIMDREKNIHGIDPLTNTPIGERYVVFMSDGQNSQVSLRTFWRNQVNTGFYRRFVRERICTWRNRRGRCRRFESRVVEQAWDIDIEGSSPPRNSGWTEGVYGTSEDNQTVNECQALKNDGVTVYTIGFALQEGEFYTNEWQTAPGGINGQITREVERVNLRRAVSLMRACATNDSTFLLANDASQLEIAFNRIGIEITDSIVRLTN